MNPDFLLYRLTEKKRVNRSSRLHKISEMNVSNGLRVVYSGQSHCPAGNKYLIKRIVGIWLKWAHAPLCFLELMTFVLHYIILSSLNNKLKMKINENKGPGVLSPCWRESTMLNSLFFFWYIITFKIEFSLYIKLTYKSQWFSEFFYWSL